MRFNKYISCIVSVIMIAIVIVGQTGQYHHHDENDDICMCLTPADHCHDVEHNDCNHHSDSEDCKITVEETIINEHDTDYDYQIVADVCLQLLPIYNTLTYSAPFTYPERVDVGYRSDYVRSIQRRGPPMC